jgi:hypothetical protein
VDDDDMSMMPVVIAAMIVAVLILGLVAMMTFNTDSPQLPPIDSMHGTQTASP